MGWIKHVDDVALPEYLKKNLPADCTLCGSPMENYYNDDNNRCTFRRCSNPECVGMKASKGAFMFKLLGVKGIGYATCRDWINSSSMKSHVQLLSKMNGKATVSLDTYLRIHCFEGVDSEWEKIVKGMQIYTLDELYENYNGKWRDLLEDNKELLYNNLQYINLTSRPVDYNITGPKKIYTIMITGTPNGYDSKEHFIDSLNSILKGQIVIIHQKTKKQSGVDFLIREPGSTTRGKLDAAIRGGIPIVTSNEFVGILVDDINKMKSEKSS